MRRANKKTTRGFSLIELVLVVGIIGVVSLIAVPRFADAGSGRRLSAAKRTLIADIQMAKTRARATSQVHVIKFYPSENRYLIVEGTDIRQESIILVRDFDDAPYSVGIKRTSLGADQVASISVYGDLSPGFTVGLSDAGTEIMATIDGVTDFGVSVTTTLPDASAAAIDTKILRAP